MRVPNIHWTQIITNASTNLGVFRSPETLKQITDILRRNIKAAGSIGHQYICQLSVIYMDMLLVYKTISENLNADFMAGRTGE